jgi:hypothetical protein
MAATDAGAAGERAQAGPFHAAFVPDAERKRACDCSFLRQLFAGVSGAWVSGAGPTEGLLTEAGSTEAGKAAGPASCGQTWGYNVGAEFWAHRATVEARPRAFWLRAFTAAVSGEPVARSGRTSASKASKAGYCFEAIWHHVLGEPLKNYRPAFRWTSDLPLASFADRCRDFRGSPLLLPPACRRLLPST